MVSRYSYSDSVVTLEVMVIFPNKVELYLFPKCEQYD